MQFHIISVRRPTWAVACVLALVVTGCGDDTQTSSSSNRGSGSDTAMTTVQNAYVMPRSLPESCAIQVGDSATLSFTRNQQSIHRIREIARR